MPQPLGMQERANLDEETLQISKEIKLLPHNQDMYTGTVELSSGISFGSILKKPFIPFSLFGKSVL